MFRLSRKENSQEQDQIEPKDGEEPEFVTSLAHEPTTHLEQYLSYYVSRLEPGYAVLVTGDWGTGKTHQVRKALPDDRAYYVSLFGIKAPEDIEAQVFSTMFPNKASLKQLADKLGDVSFSVPGLSVNGLTSILANTFIKNEINNSRPLIFDDLERCAVKNRVLLGLINRYVEHHKCRVIIIAHDDKIVKQFDESKEKIFGQTLSVEPNVNAAFSEFISLYTDEDNQDELGELKNEVLSVFQESETASLRVLRHVVEDVMRLIAALEKRHLENRIAMVELIRLFTALSIETRANRLKKADLRNRRETSYRHMFNSSGESDDEQSPPPIVKENSKYKSIDISSTLLNDQVLIEMLIEGRFIADHIRDSLNISAYFLERQDAPWQIVGSFDKLNDSRVEPALKRMEEQFAKREVTESGEFLHIVALKMMMASERLTGISVRQVTKAAKAYIDDLLREDRLPPRPTNPIWSESFSDSYASVAYWVTDAYRSEFDEVLNYLIEARCKALEDALPDRIPPLLEIVRTDGQKFFEKVCHTRNGTIEYEDIPILAHIEPTKFVDAWLASPPTGWYSIATALKERKRAVAHSSSLKPEAGWYEKVVREMNKRAKAQSGLAKLRIIRAARLVGFPCKATGKRKALQVASKPQG